MKENNTLPALKINQWLTDWDLVDFNRPNRKRPEKFFFFFSIKANDLRKLSNIYRRKANKPRTEDTGIQREHRSDRSEEISIFIKGGYPWSVLTNKQRQNPENDKLKMPGWLPTSIIANIIKPGTKVGEGTLSEEDAVKLVPTKDGSYSIQLPLRFDEKDWQPSVYPISIIDGQHRLLAFDLIEDFDADFELPVIAFFDLDITWQAYLFYTINIKPKKIKPSLAYDLFPILRTQDWLEKSPEGLMIYRETRAQELTEILWAYPQSPWHNRINMLDQPGEGAVTQAAFIRSLINSLIKTSNAGEDRIGGLFGATITDNEILNWDRFQQGAFLIFAWQKFSNAIKHNESDWAKALRSPSNSQKTLDDAFTSKYSLIATDQGVRVFQNIINDMIVELGNKVNIYSPLKVEIDEVSREQILDSGNIDFEYIGQCIVAFESNQRLSSAVSKIVDAISAFEWRTSSAPGLNEQQRTNQMAFRGSGGYKELRRQVLKVLANSPDSEVQETALEVIRKLNYKI